MEKKTVIAVVGCGRIAKLAHFPALSNIEGVKVKYACDLIKEKADAMKEKYTFGSGFLILELTFAIRSSVNQEKLDLAQRLEELAKFYDAEVSHKGDYPAWEYKKDSVLRDTMVQVYKKLYEKEPQVVAIHAGLECGLLGEKLPGLDCVSIGPEMHDIHTSREKLDIASTARTWEFLLEVLKEL